MEMEGDGSFGMSATGGLQSSVGGCEGRGKDDVRIKLEDRSEEEQELTAKEGEENNGCGKGKEQEEEVV